ncbi:MAG: hypothetical protein OXC41_03530 [Gammaproteobacteria bacterium]|nr:hypothetical protein [Gammaproteobacteria bacterium]
MRQEITPTSNQLSDLGLPQGIEVESLLNRFPILDYCLKNAKKLRLDPVLLVSLFQRNLDAED